ncbi:Bbp16 family capsid cement protein [Pandoraea sp. NPDC090278]|uniref:Bbp16 family capsid cement protein n=1 Tax=Pandoraea sp. NPDC090278 TaxID=3364391 RepID=UPI00383A837C
MILDKTEEFSDSQAVTATAVSTNVIDTNPSNKNPIVDLGDGEPDVWLVVQCDEAAAAAGAATVAISLESDSTANLATSPTVHYQTPALALAAMTAGKELVRVKLPGGDYERYLGVRYTVATGPLTAGKFSAFIVKDAQGRKTYKSGFVVA